MDKNNDMSVYVDVLINYGWKLGPSCHLTADSIEELDKFAVRIGMKKAWFQMGKNEIPHYDLTASKRKAAIDKGAIELTREQMVERIKSYLKNSAA